MANFNDEDDHRFYAMQLATASVLPSTLKAAIELGVLDIISAAGPDAHLSPSQIASKLPTQHNSDALFVLDLILRLLASHSILTCTLDTKQREDQVQRLYGLAPVAKYFVRNQDGGSLSPFVVMLQDKVIADMWYNLKDAVLEGGRPFDKAHGMNAMEFAGKDSRFSKLFEDTRSGFNPLLMERLLEMYNGFEGLTSLVDVGGGNGSILNMIVSKYPAIRGVNSDLSPVIEKAPTYPGITHVVADKFVSIPKADAIFMKWILRGWDDEACLKILKNCFEALPEKGKVIAVEMVVPDTAETSVEAKSLIQFYVYMTSIRLKGKERTRKEFECLAKEAGFSHVQVACNAYNCSIIEFIKDV